MVFKAALSLSLSLSLLKNSARLEWLAMESSLQFSWSNLWLHLELSNVTHKSLLFENFYIFGLSDFCSGKQDDES